MSEDKIEEIRARHAQSDNNFIEYESTWDIHADRATLLAEVERLTGKLKLVADALNETISKYHEVGDQNDRLDAEIERLRAEIERLRAEMLDRMADAWAQGYARARLKGLPYGNPYRGTKK